MNTLLKGHAIGVNNNFDLVFVETYDCNGILNLKTYRCKPYRVDMSRKENMNCFVLLDDSSDNELKFYYKKDDEVYSFSYEETDLEHEIKNMYACFHKDALYDLYNSYYSRLTDNRNTQEREMVNDYHMGSGDYWFPDVSNNFLFDKVLGSYVSNYNKTLDEFVNDCVYSKGAERMSDDNINHILGADKVNSSDMSL